MADIGSWVRPWRGEYLVAEIVALSGEWYLCRALNGDRFQIRQSAHPEVLTADQAASNVRLYARRQRLGSHLEVVRP